MKKKKETPAGEPTVAVRIPQSLRKRAKVLAATLDRDLQDVLAEIVEEGLKQRKA